MQPLPDDKVAQMALRMPPEVAKGFKTAHAKAKGEPNPYGGLGDLFGGMFGGGI